MRMKQREILNSIALDFARDTETQEQYLDRKISTIKQAIKEYICKINMNGFILGLSGGIDSYVAGALLASALTEVGKELHLILLPNGIQADIADSRECADAITAQFENVYVETVSIENGYKGVLEDAKASKLYDPQSRYANGNVAARLRMVMQYALAKGLLVAGTDHATENVTGYYTKYGDGGTDFNPLDGMVKSDIYDIAKRFNAPECVMKKRPAAGLGISSCDEEELGMSYAELCSYLKCNQIEKSKAERIARLFDAAEHKRHTPASPENTWWKGRPAGVTHIVVDMLYDFIDGAMACKTGVKAAENSIKYINEHPDMRVLYVRDYHPKEHCSFVAQGGRWPEHCVAGTRGSEIYGAFYGVKKTINTPIERYNIFSKGTKLSVEQYSGFNSVNDQYGALKFNLTHSVVLSGIATEYCIRETAMELLNSGFDVAIIKNATGYIDENESEEVLAELEALGARII